MLRIYRHLFYEWINKYFENNNYNYKIFLL